MKKFAKLALFFSISFILLFFFSALFKFLGVWIDALRTMPVLQDFSDDLLTSLTWQYL